jgi:RNA polymerase sigma-70 factor (ECF subfamily)
VDFDAAYQASFDLAWRTLRRMGVPQSQIDDASQDVFVIVHRRLGDFEGRSTLKTWVAGIAIRVASDYRRKKRRRGMEMEIDESIIDPRPGPLEQASRAEARAIVDQILDELDVKQREVFVLMELEGLSAPEVADVLSVNLNTVYSRLRLGRRAFDAAVARRVSKGGA